MSRFSLFLGRHRKGLVILIVVALVAGIGSAVFLTRQGGSTAKPETNVTVLKQKDLDRVITTKGVVQSTDTHTVYTQLAYKVTELAVEVGDKVAAGDFLAQLDTRDIVQSITDLEKTLGTTSSLQSAQISQAQRNVANAKDQLALDTKTYQDAIDEAAKAIEDLKHEADDKASGSAGPAADAAVASNTRVVNARAVVTAAQTAVNSKKATINGLAQDIALVEAMIAKIDAKQDEIDAAENPSALLEQLNIEMAALNAEATALLSALNSKYMLSAVNLAALKTTLESKLSGANSELIALESALDQAESDYDDIYEDVEDDIWEDEFDESYDDVYDTFASAFDAKYNLYDQAVKNLENIQRSNNLTIQSRNDALTNTKLSDNTTSIESQLITARNNLEDATVTAPVSGTITEVLATLGVRANGAMFVIQNTESLELSTTVAEYDIPLIKEGQAVQFTTDATGSDILDGTVDRISPTAINTDGDFTVTVRIDQPDERLRIGMNAKLTIVLESRPATFAVPYDAITTNAAGQTIVMALREDGVTRYEVPVTVGMETDYFVEISGPEVQPGLVVLNDPEGKNVANSSMPAGPFGG
ncbi:MAG: efflux RND transporter periplasmic adaptor subunit [Clostridiales bacterium]|nr:efflux RND transporter periplasmic adaptor subunit [Clostridiales bacterium]